MSQEYEIQIPVFVRLKDPKSRPHDEGEKGILSLLVWGTDEADVVADLTVLLQELHNKQVLHGLDRMEDRLRDLEDTIARRLP